ncbi:Subtilisin-like protease SBT1.4 [Dichanthelium oligosanthes]|uniref:Subtilisin-like protease SBT1.4 n=1 Tax=Dichanthelium oligosanthes TaxID=888268 RepID=A0A1E5WML0_9POAL|nr:Subtilisin-like protease SBT1.4 [Dichanthelium oligosanthes]
MFRGGCISAPDFNASAWCSNKLVGAKFFGQGYEAAHGGAVGANDSRSPLDTIGHGTHTASTAAGSAVANASLFGYVQGTAVGIAPGSRIAVYKACWGAWVCMASDVLMAAVRKGIVVVASAGNDGPTDSTVINVAPWILTVGASTINRQFAANVILGDGETFNGSSLYAGTLLSSLKIPLVYGGNVGSNVCEAGKLSSLSVIGKIVVCDYGVNTVPAKAEAVKLAGDARAILINRKVGGNHTLAFAYTYPATEVPFDAGEKIKNYISTNKFPNTRIVFLGTVIGRTPPSPMMTPFSSRGPNLLAPEILKPDVTAPGVNILAAWTDVTSPSGLDSEKFSITTVTSVSCAHVSGIAAMLRQAHPEWSPAVIKSALITTAYNVDNAGSIFKDASTGKAGTHPRRSFEGPVMWIPTVPGLDPGLVYDAGTDSYIYFLCALGYTADQIAVLTRDGSVTNCSMWLGSVGDHDYPGFSVPLSSGGGNVTQRRTVRNVGSSAVATYTASVTSPAGVLVALDPPTLLQRDAADAGVRGFTFSPQQGNVTVGKYSFGSIVWSDGKHMVASPIAVIWPVASAVAAM